MTAKSKIPPVPSGMRRAYYRCKQRGCRRVYWHDYIPFSLGGTGIYTDCGHSTGARDHCIAGISRREFFRRLPASRVAWERRNKPPNLSGAIGRLVHEQDAQDGVILRQALAKLDAAALGALNRAVDRRVRFMKEQADAKKN